MHWGLALALAWAGSISTALLMGRLAVRIKPELRFSTRVHEDGLDYIHQPFDVIVYVTLTTMVSLVISIFFKG